MKKALEIATIKANSTSYQGSQLYWLFSKNQLEFVLRELEVLPSPVTPAAWYEEELLPVVSLERYYGLEEKLRKGPCKFLVVRTLGDNQELAKLIIKVVQPLKMHRLDTEIAQLPAVALPQNGDKVLGMYGLSAGKLGVVPDFAGIRRMVQVPGK